MLKKVSKIILTSPTYLYHLKLIQIQPKIGVFRGPGRHFVAHRGSRWEEPQANPLGLFYVNQGYLVIILQTSETTAQTFHRLLRY